MKKLDTYLDAEYLTYDFEYGENFVTLLSGARTIDIVQYTAHGTLDQVVSVDELFTIKRTNKKDELLEAYNCCVDGYWEVDEYSTKDEIIAAIYNLSVGEVLEPSWSRNRSLDDLIECTVKFERIVSRGFSQGDIVDIIVLHSLSKSWGMKKNALIESCEEELKKELDHILWSSPIAGTLEVKYLHFENCVTYQFSREYDLEEVLNCRYEMKIDEERVIKDIEEKLKIEIKDIDREIITKELGGYNYTDVSYPCACA